MCGFAGIVGLRADARVSASELETMTRVITHRGPDDDGCYVDPRGRCGLGFRRLSIIDLQTGAQPIATSDGGVHVVFNGEIYNFRELRAQLATQGWRFRTQGDAEVVCYAYREWGAECFARFAGMFAIAIWDELRGRLLLARDRFGKKPLTYAVADGRVCFASEIKALLAAPGVTREIDPNALHEYLLFQYVRAPLAIYRGFAKVPPGCVVEVADGVIGEPKAFWTVPEPAPFEGTYEDAKTRLGELLTRAVEKRLVSDVPLGAFLSGGVDSSIVVGLMRKLGVSPLRTFAIGFPDARYDETRYARLVAERFQTEHHEQMVTPEARDVLSLLAFHYDEPFADSSAIPTYYVSRYARQYVTVALTGDAGDECFAGYDRYRAAALSARMDVIPTACRRLLARAAELLPKGRAKSTSRRLYRLLSSVGMTPSRRYLSWVNVFTPMALAEGYRADFAERVDFERPLAWFDGLYDGAHGSAAQRANRVDLQSYLPYDLLTKVDIASMACSLECRSPFLDHELAEFALSLPMEWRLGPSGGKRLLKDWAADFLPAEVLQRPKMGFGVPVGEWFRGELRELLLERLLAADALCGRIFCADWLRAFIDEHLSGRKNHEHALWALLMLELWRERWAPTLA